MSSNKPIRWSAIIFTVVNSIILAGIIQFSPDLTLSWRLQNDINISYADFIAMLLGFLSIFLALLGIIIAIITLIGYRQLKTAAIKKAEDHVKSALAKAPDGGADPELRATITALVIQIASETSERFNVQVHEGRIVPKDWGNNSEYGD